MKGVWAISVRTLLLLLSLATVDVCAANYDPLAVNAAFHPAHLDLTVHDAARNRDIPVRIYLPANTAPEPVILFSHGLGGSRDGQRVSRRTLGGARLRGGVSPASGQ